MSVSENAYLVVCVVYQLTYLLHQSEVGSSFNFICNHEELITLLQSERADMTFLHSNSATGNKEGKWLTAGDGAMTTSVSDSAISSSLPSGTSSLNDISHALSTEQQDPHSRSASASPNVNVRFRKKKNIRNNASGVRPKSMVAIGHEESQHTTGATRTRMSLSDALKDKKVKVALRMFLESEYSIENLDFWLEAEEYRKLKNPNDRKRVASQLYETYIAMGAPKQINLDHYNRGNITRDLASDDGTTRDLFVGAQKYIFNIMENDSFVRFVHSKHFEACQNSLRRNPRAILRNIFPSRRTHPTPRSQDEVPTRRVT